MQPTLLATKLFAPPPPAGAVRRGRLLERLSEGARGPLTLLSAPAGFGKTTLVAAWRAETALPVAWLSLDEGDRSAAGFLRYLAATLRGVAPEVGGGVLQALDAPRPAPAAALLPGLLNDLAAAERDLVLVLDDYHATDAREVDALLARLLERLPPRLHLVITTREDPDLPLARLRARGRMAELRAADLRFTPDEAAAFLNEVADLALAPEQVAALEARTEGWITGLQLAALSMRGRDDVAGFVRAFAGDHRYVIDYLVDEVLRRQPDEVRGFLLETSVLERLAAPLCEAVTGLPRCDRLLAGLERSNLFLVPLDDRRRWYRYHHLFADVLRVHLAEERPERVAELHRRASRWFERDASPTDALRHALAAEDYPRAADLAVRAGPALRGSYRPAELLGSLEAFPDAEVRERPALAVEYARALMDVGELEASEARLREAERWLERSAGRGDAATAASLPAVLATARSYQAQAVGDAAATVRHARRALELLPADERFERGVVAAVLGLAHWSRGELGAAHDAFAAGLARMGEAGNRLVAITSSTVLADIRLAQARPRAALRIYEAALRRAADEPEPLRSGVPNLHLGASELHWELGDREAAFRHLRRSEEPGGTATPNTGYRWALLRARLRRAEGDLAGAAAELGEAARLHHRGPLPEVRPVAALLARVRIAQGRLADAEAWARERGVSVDTEADYLREFDLLTVARLRLARFGQSREAAAWNDAVTLLGRLRREQAAREPTLGALEARLLLALAHAARGDENAALVPLGEALELAEPEGFVRLFVDEGAPMLRLLSAALERGVRPAYARRLLAAFGAAGAPADDGGGLLEPLTPRELEVLRLLAEGMSNAQIAARLHRALPTVKGYNRSLYAKLRVARRTEAVARARELGLL